MLGVRVRRVGLCLCIAAALLHTAWCDAGSELKEQIARLKEQNQRLQGQVANLHDAVRAMPASTRLLMARHLSRGKVCRSNKNGHCHEKKQGGSTAELGTALGNLDWKKCKSRGGSKECALCRSKETPNGMLDCASIKPKEALEANKYTSCPDHKILETRKVFIQGGFGGQCTPMNKEAAIQSTTLTSYEFPGVASSKHTQNVVLTKLKMGHPHKAGKDIGILVFKRVVTHAAADGTVRADVVKKGWCIKCKNKDGTFMKIYKSEVAVKATDAENKKFIEECAPSAVNATGHLRASNQCTGDDLKYAKAVITAF